MRRRVGHERALGHGGGLGGHGAGQALLGRVLAQLLQPHGRVRQLQRVAVRVRLLLLGQQLLVGRLEAGGGAAVCAAARVLRQRRSRGRGRHGLGQRARARLLVAAARLVMVVVRCGVHLVVVTVVREPARGVRRLPGEAALHDGGAHGC